MEPNQNNVGDSTPVTIRSGGDGDHHAMRIILPTLLVLILLAGGYVWFTTRGGDGDGNDLPPTDTPAVGVESTHIDLDSATEGSRLPGGFPQNIPVEEDRLTESYKAEYTVQGVIQYTVSFSSLKSVGALWDEYNTYMATAGYETDANVTNRSQGMLRGVTGPNELFVVITPVNGESYVQLNYIVRQ